MQIIGKLKSPGTAATLKEKKRNMHPLAGRVDSRPVVGIPNNSQQSHRLESSRRDRNTQRLRVYQYLHLLTQIANRRHPQRSRHPEIEEQKILPPPNRFAT